MIAPPPWLSDLQSRWSELLRSPLETSTGTFRERRESYCPNLLAAIRTPDSVRVAARIDDGLALYHQQYWMRLFSALQGRLPRFSFAIGYWHFNHLASVHLSNAHPRHFDLDRAADGLDARIAAALSAWSKNVTPFDPWTTRLATSRAPRELLEEALRIDQQERRVFDAPMQAKWQPTAADLETLGELRLRTSAAFEIVVESWDLIAHSTLTSGYAATSHAPRRLPTPRQWALYRTANGVTRLQLSRPFAALLDLCARYSFGEALRELELGATPRELALIRTELPGWVQLALANHWWVGAQ